MKRGISLAVFLSLFFVFSGCAYMDVKVPFDTNLDQTVLGKKVGKSSCHSILWLVSWGDAGTAAAARSGHITTINHMDRKALCILFGLYYRHTTIVYGD